LNFVAHMLVSNLATLRMRLSDYAGAETLYRRAMAIGVDQIGPRSLQVAIDYGNLAIALESQGRFDSALPLLREAYDRHLELLGPTHTRVANDARNIGVALRLLERSAEARPWLEQAVR